MLLTVGLPDSFMLFRLSDVYKSYGAQDVLRGASLQINPGEHVGLVGRNGAGKTTLFRLITGEETPDRGDVVRARGVQARPARTARSLRAGHDRPRGGARGLRPASSRSSTRCTSSSTAWPRRPDDLEAVLERYSDLQHEFEREGGFEYAARAEAILQGLGFERETWATPRPRFFRAGRRTVSASPACCSPSPTCCCSTSRPTTSTSTAVEWLEEFLASYKSAYVIISHDRYFLDRACTRIVEVELGKARRATPATTRPSSSSARSGARRSSAPTRTSSTSSPRPRSSSAATSPARRPSRPSRAARCSPSWSASRPCAPTSRRATSVCRRSSAPARTSLTVDEAAVGYPGKLLADGHHLHRSSAASASASSARTARARRPSSRPCSASCRRSRARCAGARTSQVGYYAQQLDDLDDRNEIIMELRRVAPSSATAGELRGFLAQVPLHRRRRLQARPRPLGRREGTARAGQAHLLARQRPRPRRADQPPRHPLARGARRGARRLRRHDHHHQPRPLLPRPRRHADPRARRRGLRRALRRRLHRVPRLEGRATRRREAAAKAAREKAAAARRSRAARRNPGRRGTPCREEAGREGLEEEGRRRARPAGHRGRDSVESSKQLAALAEELATPEVARDPGAPRAPQRRLQARPRSACASSTRSGSASPPRARAL